MNRILIGLLCLALSGVSVACSDDSSDNSGDGGGGGSNVKIGETVSKMITAADGGKVEAEGATLNIPAGALAEDTEITVKTVDPSKLPAAKDVASAVYDCGPNGTQFSKPVALELAFEGTAPKGSTAKLAWLDDDKKEWVALDDSAVSGGKATATTTHFTKFAVVFILNGDGTGAQVGGACSDMDVSCGGDVVGTWEFSGACASIDPKSLFSSDDPSKPNPLADCKGIGVAITVDITGTITFNKDKTYQLHSSTESSSKISIPKSCLANMCSFLGSADAGDNVSEEGDNCVKEEDPQTGGDDSSGTYTVDGNMLTTTEDTDAGTPGTADAPDEFCVKGNTLTAKSVEKDGSVFYYTATKK